MDAITIKIDGLAELNRRLQQLDRKVASRISRSAVTAAGILIRNEARLRAPVNKATSTNFKQFPGTLRRAITFGFDRKRSRNGLWIGRVFVRSGGDGAKARSKFDAYYWRFVEFGTKGHKIRIKNRKVLSDGGGTFFGREVNIPAIPARPFLRPAAEARARDAVEAMASQIRNGLYRAERGMG